MSEIAFDGSVIEEARRRAAAWIVDVARDAPVIRDVTHLCEMLAELEAGYERARLNLQGLHRRGVALPADYGEFENMRSAVYAAQQQTVALLRIVFRGFPDALSQIPSPKKPPALALPPAPTAGDAPAALGNPAAVGAAAIPAWMVGTIIIGIIASLIAAIFAAGLIIAMTAIAGSIAAETIRDVWLGRAQLEAHNQAREARLRAFEACIAAGGSREVCRAEAMGLVSDPPLVNPGAAGSWVPWVIGGFGLIVVAGGGLLLLGGVVGRRGSHRDVQLEGLRGSARRLSRDEFIHEPEEYGLPVKGGR